MSVTPPSKWVPLDLDAAGYNWRTSTLADNNIRTSADAAAVEQLGHAVNFIVSRMPRIVFVQGNQIYHNHSGSSNRYEVDGDQNGDADGAYYAWYYEDNVPNARDLTLRISGPPKTCPTAPTGAYGSLHIHLPFNTAIMDRNVVNIASCGEFFYQSVACNRGDIIADTWLGYLRSHNGYPIGDVCLQDDAVDSLTTDYDYCDASLAKPGEPILESMLEKIRITFDKHRLNSRPNDISWSAGDVRKTYEQPAIATPVQRILCQGTQYGTSASIFDNTITTRNADTPGVHCWARYCGVEDETDVYVAPFVCGRVTGPAGEAPYATINFIGPEHYPNNFSEVNILGNMGYDTMAGAALRLNAREVSGDVSGVNVNKIDIHAWVSASNANLEIFGLYGKRVLKSTSTFSPGIVMDYDPA